MDSFSEQLIKKTDGPSDTAKRVLILAGGAAVTLALLFVTFRVTYFALIAAAGAVWGTWYLFTSTFIEYEYIVSNEYFDIDKVIAKRKRKDFISADLHSITEFGDHDDSCGDYEGVTVMAVGGSEPLKYMILKTEQYGQTRVIFAPNEKTLKNIQLYVKKG